MERWLCCITSLAMFVCFLKLHNIIIHHDGSIASPPFHQVKRKIFVFQFQPFLRISHPRSLPIEHTLVALAQNSPGKIFPDTIFKNVLYKIVQILNVLGHKFLRQNYRWTKLFLDRIFLGIKFCV